MLRQPGTRIYEGVRNPLSLKRRSSVVAALHAFHASFSFLTGRRFTLDVRTLVESNDKGFSDIRASIKKIVDTGRPPKYP